MSKFSIDIREDLLQLSISVLYILHVLSLPKIFQGSISLFTVSTHRSLIQNVIDLDLHEFQRQMQL